MAVGDHPADPGALDLEVIDASLRSLGREMDRALRGGGSRCGSYTLLQEIGEGGYGEVYVAVQDLPIERRVAVKILKRGLDTRQILRRFELEQRALARIDHPNVAAILDAGVTEDGRPWFAMPLLDGDAITAVCEDAGLGIEQRLRLFGLACDGVQAAHAQGIVHRDLKPANVIVIRASDGTLVPKVIDFGIAKAVDDHDDVTRTVEAARLGTPAYMAPEQKRPSGARADTRSDVFALGVLLGEIAMGVRARDPAGNQPPSGCPVRPCAMPRSTARDLRAIVAMATAESPDARYQTVEALAHDVRHVLCGEPIVARPPTALASAASFARRHRAAVAVALLGAVGVLLVGALAVASAVDARTQARRAELAMVRSVAVSSALRDVLSGIEPAVAKGRDRQLVIDMLAGATRRFESAADVQDPVATAEIASVLADAYLSLDLPERSLGIVERGLSGLVSCADRSVDRQRCLSQLSVVKGDAIARILSLASGPIQTESPPEGAFTCWCDAIRAAEAAGEPWSRAAIRARIRLWSQDCEWSPGVDRPALIAEIERHVDALGDFDSMKWGFLIRRTEMSTWNRILADMPPVIERASTALGPDHPLLIRARVRLLQYRVCSTVESQSITREGVPVLSAREAAACWAEAEEWGAGVVREAQAAFGTDHRLVQTARLWQLSARGYARGPESVRMEFDALRADMCRTQGASATALAQLDAAWLGALHGPMSGKWW